jgi:hypothetical protein
MFIKQKGRSLVGAAFLFLLSRFKSALSRNGDAILIEHFSAEICQCWPGDQNGRDKGKYTEYAHNGNSKIKRNSCFSKKLLTSPFSLFFLKLFDK